MEEIQKENFEDLRKLVEQVLDEKKEMRQEIRELEDLIVKLCRRIESLESEINK